MWQTTSLPRRITCRDTACPVRNPRNSVWQTTGYAYNFLYFDLAFARKLCYTVCVMGVQGFDREGWTVVASRGAQDLVKMSKNTSANNSTSFALAA